MTMKSIHAIKEDLRSIFATASCHDLIKFYDYASGTRFHKKLSENIDNNYLDNKLRIAFDQIIENTKPSLLYDLWNFAVNKKGNTRKFFEGVDRERAEQMGKYGKAVKKILKKIEDKGFEIQVDAHPGEGGLHIELMSTPDSCYMDFIDFIYDEFLNKEEGGDWMLVTKSGNAISLSYTPAIAIADTDIDLNDTYEDDLEDETEKMGKPSKWGTGVDPTKDNDLNESLKPSQGRSVSIEIPWDDSLNQEIPNYFKIYGIKITPFAANRDTAEINGSYDSIKGFLKKELGYIESDFEMLGL